MDVLALPEFSRCMRSATISESDVLEFQNLVLRLSVDHETFEMRDRQLQIPGSDISLWATDELKLSGGRGRVTWRYEVRDGRVVIVCFALALVGPLV